MIRKDIQLKIINLLVSNSPELLAEHKAIKDLQDYFFEEEIKRFISEDTTRIFKERPELISSVSTRCIDVFRILQIANPVRADKLWNKYGCRYKINQFVMPDEYKLPLALYKSSITEDNSDKLFELVEKVLMSMRNKAILKENIEKIVKSPLLDSSILSSRLPKLTDKL